MTYRIESGIQLLSRLAKKPELKYFYPELFPSGVKNGDIIEIFSESNTSYLIKDIICKALLENCLGKDEIGILYFNCCGNIDYHEILSTIKDKMIINLSNKKEDVTNIELLENIYKRLLSNFFLVEIYDSTQLYITIHNLESILMDHPNITLLVFDNISAFYWSEQNVKITKMDVYLKNILKLIKRVTKEFQTAIIYTRPAYFSSSKDLIENLEPCSESPNPEKINYRIQIEHSKKNFFEVNIQTFQAIVTKTICIEGNTVIWV